MQPEVTQDDLEVAEAEVDFAIQNCPVEGVVSTPDLEAVTLDDLQNIQSKLKGLEGRPDWLSELTPSETVKLSALVEYSVESCPVEGTARFGDGRPILGSDVSNLARKLGAITPEAQQAQVAVACV